MDDLRAIIKELLSYKKEFNMPNLSDDCILETAEALFISQNISREKQLYKQSYSKQKEQSQDSDLITEKQKNLLERIEYQGDINSLSKSEARIIIKEYFDKKEK